MADKSPKKQDKGKKLTIKEKKAKKKAKSDGKDAAVLPAVKGAR